MGISRGAWRCRRIARSLTCANSLSSLAAWDFDDLPARLLPVLNWLAAKPDVCADLWADVWTMLALTYEHRPKISPHASTA